MRDILRHANLEKHHLAADAGSRVPGPVAEPGLRHVHSVQVVLLVITAGVVARAGNAVAGGPESGKIGFNCKLNRHPPAFAGGHRRAPAPLATRDFSLSFHSGGPAGFEW